MIEWTFRSSPLPPPLLIARTHICSVLSKSCLQQFFFSYQSLISQHNQITLYILNYFFRQFREMWILDIWEKLVWLGLISRKCYRISIFFLLLFTLNCLNFVFRSFLRCNSRWAPIVYRLIGAALIGIFFQLSLHNLNFSHMYIIWPTRQLRVKSSSLLFWLHLSPCRAVACRNLS